MERDGKRGSGCGTAQGRRRPPQEGRARSRGRWPRRRPPTRPGSSASGRRPGASAPRWSTTCSWSTTSRCWGASGSMATTPSPSLCGPAPTSKPRTREGRMLKSFRARAWVSESDFELARLDVEADRRRLHRPWSPGPRAQGHHGVLHAAQGQRRSLAAGAGRIRGQRPGAAARSGCGKAACSSSRTTARAPWTRQRQSNRPRTERAASTRRARGSSDRPVVIVVPAVRRVSGAGGRARAPDRGRLRPLHPGHRSADAGEAGVPGGGCAARPGAPRGAGVAAPRRAGDRPGRDPRGWQASRGAGRSRPPLAGHGLGTERHRGPGRRAPPGLRRARRDLPPQRGALTHAVQGGRRLSRLSPLLYEEGHHRRGEQRARSAVFVTGAGPRAKPDLQPADRRGGKSGHAVRTREAGRARRRLPVAAEHLLALPRTGRRHLHPVRGRSR